jgi:hypothetical protein
VAPLRRVARTISLPPILPRARRASIAIPVSGPVGDGQGGPYAQTAAQAARSLSVDAAEVDTVHE